jgi:hypothetical protein
MQQMGPLTTGFTLVKRNLAVKLAAGPPTGPFVFTVGVNFACLRTVLLKHDTPNLSVKGFIAPIIFDLLLLVV